MRATIREIIQEGARRKYGSVKSLCRAYGIDYSYLSSVLSGYKISRPLIFRIAKDLGMPELCFLYEQFLHEKRLASRQVESKAGVSTGEKEGGR